MENQKNDNLNLLEAVVQNTEMGKNTLEQIVPMTDDVQFKAELLRQRNVYHQLNQEAHTECPTRIIMSRRNDKARAVRYQFSIITVACTGTYQAG